MRYFLKNCAIAACLTLLAFGIGWCVLTDFGKRTGVYIEQKVELYRFLDSSYIVSSYVSRASNFGFDYHIEWSTFKFVKCYDVPIEKIVQYNQSLKIKDSVERYLKEVHNDICKP